MHRAIKEFFCAVLQVVIFMLSLRVCVLSAHLLLQHYHREWTFYSFNQITMLFKHYPCYQILIIFFTFWVIFHCATNSHVEHIMAFVLIPAVNQRPGLKLAYLCYHQLKLFFGAAWKSNIELFFFLSLTLILGLSIKTYIPVVWALEQFWDLVKYFLSKANPFRNNNTPSIPNRGYISICKQGKQRT